MYCKKTYRLLKDYRVTFFKLEKCQSICSHFCILQIKILKLLAEGKKKQDAPVLGELYAEFPNISLIWKSAHELGNYFEDYNKSNTMD